MLPASLDVPGVWRHRWRLTLMLRRRFVRSLVAAVLVLLLYSVEWSMVYAPTLLAQSPAELPLVRDRLVSLLKPDSSSDFNETNTGWLQTDPTNPMLPEMALDRSSPWKQSARGLIWSADSLTLVAFEPEDETTPASEPNISEPGPDLGDFPNSAYTLPQGRIYVEFAPLTLQTANRENSAAYGFPFLLRYGITDDVELRLISYGLASIFNPGNTVSGFAPLIIDTKVHLWNARREQLIPAASLEVYIQTNLATKSFQGGVEPSLNLNLDFPLTEMTNIQMTFGYTGVRDNALSNQIPGGPNITANVYQFSYQWAVERQLNDSFQVFLHGYYNGTVYLQSGPGTVLGTGWFYKVSTRLMLFSSYNFGLDPTSPPFSTQLGMSIAL